MDRSLPWLDPENRDDRLIATTIEVMRTHPRSPVVLVSTDINAQNKAEHAELPRRASGSVDDARAPSAATSTRGRSTEVEALAAAEPVSVMPGSGRRVVGPYAKLLEAMRAADITVAGDLPRGERDRWLFLTQWPR
jgi:hypothetical protein